jgi:DNA-binding LytR/AlgR family response regulator
LNIAICDDEKRSREELHKILICCETLLPDTSVFGFSSGIELINEYQKRRNFDLIFLDIDMPELSGIETGRNIREMDNDVLLVFLTNFPSFVFRSFQLGTFDYLVKPAKANEINQLMDRVIPKYLESHYMINLKWQDRVWAIAANKVVYIEGYRRHVVFYTRNEHFECVGKLGEYETKLVPYGFLRCHQGFLINMKYIKRIDSMSIMTTTGVSVDMSVRKRQGCLQAFSKYIARYIV